MTNSEKFFKCYKNNLVKARSMYPHLYVWDIAELDGKFDLFKKAILSGNFNKETYAVRWTCEDLKIKHNYSAIKAYLTEG